MPFVRFQFRRGTASQWAIANPILNEGEMAIETDTKKFKIGDGSTYWNSLAYGGLVGPQGSMSTDVSYAVTFGNNISVALDISLGGNLISKYDVSINRNLRVASDVSLGSNLYVAKDISLGGNLTVGKQIGIGKSPGSGYALDMNGNIFLSGNIYTTGGGLYNSFNYNTDLSINANLRIAADASFGGNIFASKTVNLRRLTVVGGTSGAPVTVSPTTSLIELNGTIDGTNNYFTLANGSYDGQIVTIVSNANGVSDYLNANGGTNIKLNGASCPQIRFSNSFQSVDMKWSSGSSAWFVTSWQGVNFQNASLNFGTYSTGDINFYAAVNTYVDSKLTVNKDATMTSNLFVGKDTSLSGNLTVVKDVSFGSNLFVGKDVSLLGKLTVVKDVSLGSNLFVGKDASLLGKLTVINDVSLGSNLFVGKDVSLLGKLTVINDVSLGSNLFVGKDASLLGKLTVVKDVSFGGNLLVGKDVSFNSKLYVVGTSNFVGDSSYNGNLTILKDASFGGKLTVGSDTSLNGKLYVAGTSNFVGDSSYNGNLTVIKDVSFGGKLTVGSDASLNGKLYVVGTSNFVGDSSYNGNLTVFKDVSFGSNLFVGKDASLNGKLYVQGVTTLFGTSNFVGDSSYNGNLTVVKDVSFGSNLFVGKDASLLGNLTVVKDVSFGGKLFVGSEVSLNSKLYVQGVTTLFGTSNFIGDSSYNGNLTVIKDVSFGGKLSVGSDTSLNSKLYVQGTSNFVGDSSYNGNLTVVKDVSFGGKLFVGADSSLSGKLRVAGDVSFNSNLFVGKDISGLGKLFVAGDASLNSNLFVGKDASIGSRLFVTGNIAVGSSGAPLAALEIKGSSLASNPPHSGYNLLRLISTKVGDPSYCMALGVDSSKGFGYINAAGLNIIPDVALQTRGGNVVIGNSSATTSTGKLHIYEPIGTDATNNGTNTYGSLVLEHGDASGVSSIVFPSKKNLANYGYLKYRDAGLLPLSDYAFDLSSNNLSNFVNQGIVGGSATVISIGGLNGSLQYPPTYTPSLSIAGTTTPSVLNFNQTNLLIGQTDISIAYFTQSIVKTGNQISFSAWIKPNTVFNPSCTYSIFQLSDDSNTNIFSFYLNGDHSKLYATIGGDTANAIYHNTALNNTSWQHIAVTYNGAGVGKIYINGNALNTTDLGTGFTGKGALGLYTKYFVGVNPGFLTGTSGNKGYNGLMAFMNINRYALSQIEVGNFVQGTVNNGLLIIGSETDSSGVNQDNIVLYSAGGNGFVGVNTMTPQYPLHVAGNTGLIGAVGVGKAPSSTYALDISGNVNFSGTLFNNGTVFTSGGGGSTGPTLALTGNLFVGNSDLTPGARMRVYESTGTLAAANGVGSLVIEHGNAGGGSSLVFPSAYAKNSDYAYIQYKDNNDLPMSTIALDFSDGTPGSIPATITNTGTFGSVINRNLNLGPDTLLQYVTTDNLTNPTWVRSGTNRALWFNNTNTSSGSTTIIGDLCGNLPDSDAMSFSAWIYPTTVSSSDCVFHIFQTYDSGNTKPVVRAFLQDGYFVVQLNDNRGYYKMSNTKLVQYQWQHVAFTYNGNNVGNIYLGGGLNERSISPLVLKYDFETSPVPNAGTFPDLSGTLSPNNSISTVQKKYGNSSMLCATGGSLSIPSLSLQNYRDGLTISFWFLINTAGNYTLLTCNGNGAFVISATSSNTIKVDCVNGGGSATFTTTATFTLSTTVWQFCCVQITYPSSGIGTATSTCNVTINSTTNSFSNTFRFPETTYSSGNLLGSAFNNGYIDDFRIYNSSSITVSDINGNIGTANPTPGYTGINTLNFYNKYTIGGRPGRVTGSSEYGIYQKGYAGYMNYFTENTYALSATEVSLLYNGNVDAGLLTIGVENDSFGVATDNIVLWPAAGNGCVGINKKNPLYTLDVSGSVRVGADTNGNGSVTINSGLQLNKYGMVIDYTGDGSTGYGAIWGENQGVGYQPVSINPYGGNVGIGTTTPAAKLDVNGNIGLPYAKSIVVEPQNTNFLTNKLIETGWDINGMTGDVVSIYTPGTQSSTVRVNISSSGRINLNGNVGIGTTTPATALQVNGTTTSTAFNATSDYRIKTDVQPLSNINSVDSLNPVSYFNNSLGKYDYGFIAHEVQQVFPELVSGQKDGEVHQTLNYLGLIAVLTREIKELKRTVAELDLEISQLKKY